jgi:hypothetical protein
MRAGYGPGPQIESTSSIFVVGGLFIHVLGPDREITLGKKRVWLDADAIVTLLFIDHPFVIF